MELEQPDEITRVPVHGHEVAAYSFGTGTDVILCLHGGPGMSCDYVRDSHSHLALSGYRVVAYDQLGCGASDRPDDVSLWTLERYVEEVEIVRATLGLGEVHLLGQSWGAFLAIEYALTYPDRIKSLILADGAASIPHLASETDRLREALGGDTVAMLQRHEAEGSFDHPEYKGAMDILAYRHVCRLQTWPDALMRSINQMNLTIYETIVGPNDYCVTGNIKGWDRLDQLHKIQRPVLLLAGLHDILTPRCVHLMQQEFPSSEVAIFSNSSHTPFFEEPETYFATLKAFLARQAGVAGRS